MSVTLVEFTDRINRIIKSKWEMLEELEITLPTVSDVKNKLISENLDNTVKSIIHDGYNKYEKVFIFTETEEDGSVSINYATKNGPKTIATFIIETSKKFKNAPKAVNIEFTCPETKEALTIKEFMDNITEENRDADMVQLYMQLPDKDKIKEYNLVCPKCGDRGSLYFAPFDGGRSHAFTCGTCDFVGKSRQSKHETIDLWVEKDFKKAVKQTEKENKFKEITDNTLKNLETHLTDLKSVKQNKKVAYTNEDLQKIKNKVLQMVNETFDYLEKR